MKKRFLLSAIFFYYLPFIYCQAGNLDSSFGTNGSVTADVGERPTNSSTGRQVLLKGDGSMYVLLETKGKDLRSHTFITKRDYSGAIDRSYGKNGFSDRINMSPAQAAMQPDGKIVVAGSASGRASDFVVGRYNSNGSLDNTFGDNGIEVKDFVLGDDYSSGNDYATSVAIQGDGKIVLAGLDYRNSQPSDFITARYNYNGSLDSSFNDVGFKITNFSSDNDEANSVAIQSDGKIVVAGSTSVYVGSKVYNLAAVCRYNTDGKSDNTFGSDGKKTIGSVDDKGVPSNFVATSMTIQNNGRIVIAGHRVARLNTNGTMDITFGKGGIQTKVLNSFPASQIAIQSDGKIVLAGPIDSQQKNDLDFAVARYNSDGSLDSSFSGDGIQTTDFNGENDFASSLAVQPDGKILVTGSDITRCNLDDCPGKFAIARYNINGTADNTFGESGRLTGGYTGGNTTYKKNAVQKDGKIVVVGNSIDGSNDNSFVARYNTNGVLDKTFGEDGIQRSDFDITAVAIQRDEKIVVAGSSSVNNHYNFTIARYNTDGRLDNSFSEDGIQTANFSTSGSIADAVTIQPDGKIIVAGGASDHLAIVRYNTDGSLDNTFSNDGLQTNDLLGPANSVAMHNSKIIVLTNSAIARYNIDGSLDNTFGLNGIQNSDFNNLSLGIQSDDKIVVGGSAEDTLGQVYFTVSRYNFDGSLDSSFSEDGKDTTKIGASTVSFSIAIQNDGKIVAGGSIRDNDVFGSFFALVRYNTTGDLDSTFSLNGIQITTSIEDQQQNGSIYSTSSSSINCMAILEDKLYAVGFHKYQGDFDFQGTFGVIAQYLLNDNQTPPTVTLTTPANNSKRLAPAAHIKLSAVAADKDGTISKVEFYSGSHLLHTETVAPYGFVWRNVPVGDYTLTAKAYDNSGLVTASAPVHISVVPNKPPVVSIINPKNNQTFPTDIPIQANAKDPDGRMARVEFYNGSTLLNTQYLLPYKFVWKDVPAGTYTLTAVAIDNWGTRTTSAPVTFRVLQNTTIVSNRPSSVNNKTGVSDAVSLTLSPNPANSIVNLHTTGLQQDKPATIRVLSASGVVIKTMHLNSLDKTIRLDVSSMARGVYTIQLLNDNKVLFKQFVKL